MRIHIGRTIAERRRARGLTQEALAGVIGVSAPAVSKWETGQSYPDIALLPPLARYLDCTVDQLLSYRATLTDKERESLVESAMDVSAAQGFMTGLAHMDALLREYPDDMPLRMLCAACMTMLMVHATDDHQRQEGRARQRAWLQEAAEHAEGVLRLTAQYQLAQHYMQEPRDLDRAEALLDSLQALPYDVAQMMPTLRMLQGRMEEAVTLAERNLRAETMQLLSTVNILSALSLRQDHPDDAERYVCMAQRLTTATGIEDTTALLLAQMRMRIAVATKDDAALLDALDAFAQALPRSPAPFPSFHEALLPQVIDDMQHNPCYDAIRATDRFAQILQTLQKATPA